MKPTQSGARFVAILLVTTCLVSPLMATSVRADGGRGGGAGAGDGGIGFTSEPGIPGSNLGGGGGGAAGGEPSAGDGGAGGAGSGTPAAGGLGGTEADRNGGNGGASTTGGGGGGGGGFHGNGDGAPFVLNSSTISGGNGGSGGSSTVGGGGGGGGGGYGAIITTSFISGNTETGIVQGGRGGDGGSGMDDVNGGSGGDGGVGVRFIGPFGGVFFNSGTVRGGDGGTAAAGGNQGAGGAGIVATGQSVLVTNFSSGQISAGADGDGVIRDYAIIFAGTNRNELAIWAGSSIVGNVVAFGTTNVLNLTGDTNGTFDVSQIGDTAQYQGFNQFTKTSSNTWTLTGTTTALTPWSISSGGILNVSSDATLGDTAGGLSLIGGTFQWGSGFSSARTVTVTRAVGGTLDTNGFDATLSGTIQGTGSAATPARLVKAGLGTLTLTGSNSYEGGWAINGGALAVSSDAQLGAAAASLSFGGGTLQYLAAFDSNRAITLNAAGGTFDTGAGVATSTLSGAIGGSGSLTKAGNGTLVLTGTNGFTGGAIVNAGTLRLGSAGAFVSNTPLTVNGGTFDLNDNSITVNALSSSGGAIALGNAALTASLADDSTVAAVISGGGSLVKDGTGILTLTGSSTYTGPTTLNAGGLVVNGSLASTVTMNAGTLGGSGTIGGLNVAGGIVGPGNSIGTLTVNGNFTQTGGVYQVEVNAAGESDRIDVTGTATINGGTVQVLAQPGTYQRNTTYTILNAVGGVSGAYADVSSNFAFLTPTLSYDANNVFLLLALSQSAFASGAQTANQFAVGTALDLANSTATGDFNTVLNALSALSTQQGPWALNQISGQPYADFGSFNVANNALFMNALGQQMALARGASGSGQRVAMAQACDVAACDAASPFSVWGSVLGGVGSVQGDGNSSTFTYNVGGAAAGIDYRVSPSVLVGIGAGYTNGMQWVDSFSGKGWSNTVSVAAYGSFTQWGLYVDALAGYAYSNNQLQRQVSIPGLQPRTANGSTGANQFLGQVEAGYKLGIYAPAQATVTPFARFQASSINQAAFSEWGADSLSLNVAQQTTTSLRTVLGADLAGTIGLGDTRTLDFGLRLGWLHEYADTARPVTAAFAGAPSASFTVYGAAPQRDAAVIGFSASTTIAEATQLYLRYDGDVGSGTDNHTLNLGLRLRW